MQPELLIPVIAALGFGIQQFLQVVADPAASVAISLVRGRQPPQPDGSRVLPGGISDVDAKKVLLGATSFTLGLLIVRSSDGALLVLQSLGLTTLRGWDFVITALTVGAGAEGANSTLKLFQYAKDAMKSKTPPSVALNSPVPQQPDGRLDAGGASRHLPEAAYVDAEPDAEEDERLRTPNSGDDEEAVDEGRPAWPGPAAHVLSLAPETFATAAAPSWRVARSLLRLRDQVDTLAPGRNKRSDGFVGDLSHQKTKSDHNPWVKDGAQGVVTAFDITHDPGGGCDANKIAEAIRKARDPRVKYIIWNRRIANSAPLDGMPAWAWRKYTGKNPHESHVHISVKPEKPLFDSPVGWDL